MTSLFRENTRFREMDATSLISIFRPVSDDLRAVHERLAGVLRTPQDATVREIVEFLLQSPGKRIRPALVLLSARAASGGRNGHPEARKACVNMAAAVELIHMASLVHDDLIDAAPVRHHRSSINARWGARVSIALGDYLCASAFRLMADCEDARMFEYLGFGLCAMCEGEMRQVASRGNFGLSEHDCLDLVEKKTAALFAASCGAGAAAALGQTEIQNTFQRFGLHVGMAFQIFDDCKDLLSDQAKLGKKPAQDLLAGDVTLPLLFLLEHMGQDRDEWVGLDAGSVDAEALTRIKVLFHSSQAGPRIEQLVRSHTDQAKQELESIVDSAFKESLHQLADYIAESLSEILAR